VGTLIEALTEKNADAAVRDQAAELLEAFDLLHRQALTRLAGLLSHHELLEHACEDPVIGTVLDLYELKPEKATGSETDAGAGSGKAETQAEGPPAAHTGGAPLKPPTNVPSLSFPRAQMPSAAAPPVPSPEPAFEGKGAPPDPVAPDAPDTGTKARALPSPPARPAPLTPLAVASSPAKHAGEVGGTHAPHTHAPRSPAPLSRRPARSFPVLPSRPIATAGPSGSVIKIGDLARTSAPPRGGARQMGPSPVPERHEAPTEPPVWTDVCSIEEVQPGTMYAPDQGPLLLINLDGRIYAYRNGCGTGPLTLHTGKLQGNRLVCAWHLGCIYDVTTGVSGIPPDVRRLIAYPAEVKDGRIRVALNRGTLSPLLQAV
jgi:nitrite reductase/ring-hydroxylating ferredoxin subunit